MKRKILIILTSTFLITSQSNADVEGCPVPLEDCYMKVTAWVWIAGTIFPGAGTPCTDVKQLSGFHYINCEKALSGVPGKTSCSSSYFTVTLSYTTRPCGGIIWGPILKQTAYPCNATLAGETCTGS